MTRTRRIVGAGMATLATLAALSVTGQALAAEHSGAESAGLSPQRMAATADPGADDATRGRGRGGYGYGQTTPPGGEQPSTPPGGEQPSTPPGGEQPSTPPGGEQPSTPPGGEQPSTPPAGEAPTPSSESPGGESPAGDLPTTGAPMTALVLLGGLLAVAGVALRYLARGRRTS